MQMPSLPCRHVNWKEEPSTIASADDTLGKSVHVAWTGQNVSQTGFVTLAAHESVVWRLSRSRDARLDFQLKFKSTLPDNGAKPVPGFRGAFPVSAFRPSAGYKPHWPSPRDAGGQNSRDAVPRH